MRITIILFALFHSVLMFGQDKDTSKNKIHHSILCLGDYMVLGEKTIKIKQVISDSRCPKGVTCIWAGEVKVLVEFYDEGKFKGDKIITGSNISVGETEIIPGFNISIADFFDTEELNIRKFVVTPYPEAGYKISQEEYSVELTVSEAGENN
ncbi:hypothetical protein NE848_09190 [Gramella jeungdoensis]|uniref:DUF4920 domain-containing protein n=1 Tax=Gramella jeungdoensis TaxID=708091 RepID=A0ABT0Z1F1_9FLAO|nr:hypothetical protein [Gramella jeungdoensis]MCM8569553.1 hypothetical protein [Gramella jeungdoensis]